MTLYLLNILVLPVYLLACPAHHITGMFIAGTAGCNHCCPVQARLFGQENENHQDPYIKSKTVKVSSEKRALFNNWTSDQLFFRESSMIDFHEDKRPIVCNI
jgi:hypothetical protein